MPPKGQQIDAIYVGVGLDLRKVEGDLQRIQREVNLAAKNANPVNIPARMFVHQDQVRNFRREIEKQLRTSGAAVHVPITIHVNNQELRNFKRTLERQLRGFGTQQQGIHVPIQVANLAQFHRQIETYLAEHSVDVFVNARFRDGGRGGQGGGGGGAPRGGPGPTPAPTSGGAAQAQESARNRPARGRAQQTATPVSTAQDEVAAQRERRRAASADARQQQRDRAQDQREAARDRRDRQRAQQDQQAAQATSEPREQRRVRRAAEAATRTVPQAPAERVSTDTLRARRAEEELQGEERAAYIGQLRAPRGSRRDLGTGGRASRRAMQRQEEIAQARFREASAGRVASDRDARARGFLGRSQGFSGLLGALEPEGRSANLSDLQYAIEEGREERDAIAGFASRGGRQRRRLARVRGTRKNFNADYVDPELLLADAALSAAYQQRATLIDPLAAVQKGDNKLRGRGGKVGRSGGFTAGRLASESVDPAAVQAMVDAGRVTKDDVAQYGRSSAQRARAILQERRPRRPGEPGNPEEGGAAYIAAGTAEPIYGGQGMSRGTPDIAAETRARESARRARAAEAELGPRPASPSPGPIPRTGPSIFGEPAPYAPGDEPGFGRTRASRPKQNMGGGPTARNTEYQGSSRGREYDYSGFGRAYRDARRSQGVRARTAEERRAQRIQALKNMADVSRSASPAEAEIAREFLRRYGVEGFAEGGRPNFGKFVDFPLGGSIPGRVLREALALEGDLPRPGSRSRQEIEDRFKVGVRNRRKYEAKPLYQRGGKSDTRYATVRKSFLQGLGPDIRCSNCGRQIHPGSKGPDGLALDHVRDSASGGDIYDPGNFQVLCNSCNGFKSGGRSARSLMKPDPWGPDRTSWEDEMGLFRRAEGGSLYERIQRAKMAQAGQQPQMRSSGMPERAAQRPDDFAVTKVGEQGPELILQDKNTGESHVVPAHKVPTWLQRARDGRGVAKDLTGRAMGGPLRINRAGQYIAGGTRVTEEHARTGDVVRVFVVNWPNNIGAGYGSLNNNPPRGRANAPGARTTDAEGAFTAGSEDNRPPRPGAPRAGRVPPNPAAAGEARRTARFDEQVQNFEERILQARAEVTTSLQEAPVRALSVAIGQIAQTAIGGRGGILTRARQANQAAGQATQEQQELRRLIEGRERQRQTVADIDLGVSDIEPDRQTAARADSVRLIERYNSAIEEQTRLTERATTEAEARAKGGTFIDEQGREQRTSGVLTRTQQFRAQGVGLAGIVGGTQLFTAAVASLTFLEEAATRALAPIIDQTLGWAAALDRTSGALSQTIEQTRQAGGQRQAIAQLGIATGASADVANRQLGPLADRATAQAAARIGTAATDAVRAAVGQASRGNEALFTGTGGLAGGSLFAEQLGGQRGLLQTLTDRLKGARAPVQPDQGSIVNNSLNDATLQTPILGGVLRALGARTTFERQLEFQGKDQSRLRQIEADTLKDVNASLDRYAKSVNQQSAEFQLLSGATEDQKNAMIESAKSISADAEARARELAGLGIAVTGRGGGQLRGRDFERFAQQFAQGTIIQDPRLLLQQTANERRARAGRIAVGAENQRRQDIPAEFALQEIARPLPRFGTSFSTANVNAQTPFGEETLRNVQKYEQLATSAQDSINAGILEGRNAIDDIVGQVGPDAVRTVNQLMTQIQGIGREITDINEAVALRQNTFEEHSFANSIRLTERSLQDAKDLYSGIQGSVIDTVGGLQGQNILLERQNQILSRRQQQLSFRSAEKGFAQSDLQVQLQNLQFAQTQRQINFQKALAGFVAPGTTPEERAARIQEAKLVAAEAQRQLNLQIRIARLAREQLAISKQQLGLSRQQFANQNQIQDNQFRSTVKEARRAIEDIGRELDLLQEGHAVSIDTKAAEEAIARLEKQQGRLIQKTQSYIREGQEVRDAILDDVASISAATGRAFGELVKDVSNAWSTAFVAYRNNFLIPIMRDLNNMANYSGTGNEQHPTQQRTPSAAGYSGRVNVPTRFIAGDAGGEHVLVIKNPQEGMYSMPMGGGWGGGAVVQVGGISVTVAGSVDDPERFATMIAAKVEQRLNNKLALQSAGRPLAQ